MRILHIDIETSPTVAYVWRTYKENIGIEQIIDPTRLLCAAWSWDDSTGVAFVSEWGRGREKMILDLWALLDQADAVVHYNGASFDVPHLNREFMEEGLTPPSPYQQIDLYRAVAKTFRFPSNKLAYVSKVLDLGEDGKIHTDFRLWKRVLAGEKAARKEMEAYNIEDVVILKELYHKILPWIPSHPNVGVYTDDGEVCVACGGGSLVREGWAYTSAGRFQRYSCNDCGKWMRSAKRESTTVMRAVR